MQAANFKILLKFFASKRLIAIGKQQCGGGSDKTIYSIMVSLMHRREIMTTFLVSGGAFVHLMMKDSNIPYFYRGLAAVFMRHYPLDAAISWR